jgi:hypothetical protein
MAYKDWNRRIFAKLWGSCRAGVRLRPRQMATQEQKYVLDEIEDDFELC